ncbi:MAG: PAS domain S-box protein, partial [Alphaproteobacteria bacterium]|nr:PAS domain S-box protein [Alphaproteobacteria bacterium]
RNAFIDFTGFFIFALGAHALGGHLQSVEQAYAWGSQTRMSLHTALSNMTLGMGLLSLSWSAQKADKAKIPFWVPAVMCFLALQADLIVPVDVNASIIYIPLLFCSLWFPAPGMVFIFAAITTFFTTWRFLILPPEYMTQELVTNRFITIATIWFISVLIYWKRTTDIVSQRNKKYLQAVLDNTVDGIVVIDDEGRIKDFNTACEKLFGYETPEIMGKNVNVLMPAPYHDEHDQYLSHYLATGQKKIIGIGRQVEGRHKDGTIFPIDLSVSELTINGTQFFTGIIRDIREIEELKKTEEELLRSNTELERFAFVAAHDLQEPLRIITKSSEFIQEDYGKTLDQEGLRYLGNIQASARHMRGLISDLLDYSRLGSEENAYDEISVYDAIQTALANLTEDIKTRKTTITIDEDNLPLVAANPVQLVRLYQNLIGNALKYSDKEERIIHMGVQDEGEKWLFFVKDNGIGIDPQYQDQIFVPFKRLHTRKDYPGTGIGLAMCKRIVENHDGRIWCDSTLGNGTTFYFSLPKSEA